MEAPTGVGYGKGVSPFPVGSGLGPGPKIFFDFFLRNVEVYAFWTLEHGDSTATVIIMIVCIFGGVKN